jgi:4'-phosphopantetheinyl transferase
VEVFWLEQAEIDVPAGNDWLSASEATRLDGMRFPRRRDSWRLGRWTAKRALATCLDLPGNGPTLAGIEIRSAPSGAPEVFLANEPAAITISLSHRAGRAICAVALSHVALGCDLEVVEKRSDAFVADYFTAAEQVLVALAAAEERTRLSVLLWSGKESALKALGTGLRLDTRCVVVHPGDRAVEDTWLPLEVHHTDSEPFRGWWRYSGNLLQTLVAAPPPEQPIFVRLPLLLDMLQAAP